MGDGECRDEDTRKERRYFWLVLSIAHLHG